MSKNEYLEEAVKMAVENVQSGNGGPFGALIVKDGQIIARGANYVTRDNDPTAHAEIVAIRNACRVLASFQLTGCEIYSSCEPCPMCLGAIYWARLDTLHFASDRYDAAGAGFDDSFIYEELAKPAETRQITTRQLTLPGSLAPFDLWRTLVDRQEY